MSLEVRVEPGERASAMVYRILPIYSGCSLAEKTAQLRVFCGGLTQLVRDRKFAMPSLPFFVRKPLRMGATHEKRPHVICLLNVRGEQLVGSDSAGRETLLIDILADSL